jgi:hypothetical protein
MAILKELKDNFIKAISDNSTVPRGLYDSREYFRLYGPIYFDFIRKDGYIIAKSTNFHWGSIITEGKDEKELDKNVQDAILTAFEIPSSYSKEASIKKVGSEKEKKEYAIA